MISPFLQLMNAVFEFSLRCSVTAAPGSANSVPKGSGSYTLDLSRPLSDITMDIIRLVLEENDGNQSAAAKQLKIGRSTLWRYMTRSEG